MVMPSRAPAAALSGACSCTQRLWKPRLSDRSIERRISSRSKGKRVWIWGAPMPNRRSSPAIASSSFPPEVNERGGDDLVVGYGASEKPDVPGEAIHLRHRLFRDDRVVVRQVALDQLGDHARLRGRKNPFPHFGRLGAVGPKRPLRPYDGADRPFHRLGLRCDFLFGGNQRGKRIAPPLA